MFRLVTALILLAPLTISAAGQQTVPLGNRHYDVFEVTPSDPVHSFSVDVAAADRLVIDIATPETALDVTVTRPDGSAVDAASLEQFTISDADVPPLGAVLGDEGEHTQLAVVTPMDGTWTVEVMLPSGETATAGNITALATGGLQAGATTSRNRYPVGQPAVLVVPVFFEGDPVAGAGVEAEILAGDSTSPVQTLTLRDDGASPDAQAGDGLYTASATGLSAGDYLVRASVESDGQTATAGTNFSVSELLGRFDGAVSDSGVDTNGDGLFERVDLALGVDIEQAGAYQIVGELGLGSDKRVRAGTRAELGTGKTTVAVPFGAEELKTYLAGDGPWRIEKIQLTRLPDSAGGRAEPADRRLDIGMTDAYTLDQLQRPITLVRDGFTATGVDTDGNGLYDRLDVAFEVDTLRAGSYTWTGNLKADDGSVIAIASGRGSLPEGVTEVDFAFDGETIGENGVDGPYTIGNIAVYGPPEAATVRERLGETRAFLASEFEGGAVTFANLIRQVEDLVITGIGGKPRAEGIRTSLLRKLENARASHERGKTKTALNQLGAFVNELEAQTGKHIAEEDAEHLIELTERLMAGL